MFREVARKKQVLSEEACREILRTAPRGVLSVIGDDGYPYGTPINHLYCEEDGKLYFHGGKKGHKIDAMRACDKACFVCTDGGKQVDDGWWLRFRSVVVFGRIEFVDDPATIDRVVRQITKKFIEDELYFQQELEEAGNRTLVFALVPEHMTGKTVNER